MALNLVDTWLETMERDGIIQADAIRLLNHACNRQYNSSRLNKFRKGRLEPPADVQRYMLKTILKAGLILEPCHMVGIGGDGIGPTRLQVEPRYLTKLVQMLTPLPRDRG